jgi:hypothetical protein
MSFIKTNELNEINETSYVKDQDKVYIKTETDYVLRSKDVTFKIEEKHDDNKSNKIVVLQEVFGHKEKFNEDDEVLNNNIYLF